MVVVEAALATSVIGWGVGQLLSAVVKLLSEVVEAYQRLKTECANVCELRDLLERLKPAVDAMRFVSDEEHPAKTWLTHLRAQLETAHKLADTTRRTVEVVGVGRRVHRIFTVSRESKKVRKNIRDLLIEAGCFQWAIGMDIRRILAENAEIREELRAAEERQERLIREVANMQTKEEILRGLDEIQRGFFRPGEQITSKISDVSSTSAVPTNKLRKDSVWHVPKVQVTFGGEEVANKIRNYLLNGEYSKGVGLHGNGKTEAGLQRKYKKWVGLWGMGGIGKTVAASNIYHDPEIRNYFSGGIQWVTVSKEQLGPYHLYKQLVEQVQGREKVSKMPENLEAAKSYIMSLLDGDRVLLILDDVWESEDGHDVLEYLDLVSEDKESVILVTTRDKDILGRVSRICELFEIPILSEEDSWQLFSWHAFRHHRRGREVEVPHDLQDVAEDVAKECRGLPLALEVIGSTMADKRISAEQEKLGLNSLRLWQRVLNELKNAKYGKNDYQRLLQRLQLSVDSLDGSCLKDCFFYFAAFPEDANVSVEKLVHIWVAEGLVKDDADFPGEVEGRFLLACLVAKSMLQMRGDNYESLRCKVHDVMRDVARHNLQWDFEKRKEIEASARDCLYNPGRQQFELPKEWTKSAAPSSARRLSMQRNCLQQFPMADQFHTPDLQVLILSKNPRLQSLSLRFFQALSNLRVLDLSHTGIERLSGDLLEGLPSLVLLDLMACMSLVEISDEIGKLSSLEYVDLSYCEKLTKLPRLNELTKLRWFAMDAPEFLKKPQEDDDAASAGEDDEAASAGEDDEDASAGETETNLRDYEDEPNREDGKDGPTVEIDADDKRMAQANDVGRTSYDSPTPVLREIARDSIPLVLPPNLTQLIVVGSQENIDGPIDGSEVEGLLVVEKYTFDFSSLYALEKLTLDFLTSFPVGMDNLHHLKILDMDCRGEPVPALGKLDKLEFLRMAFYTSLGTESYGDEGAFPCLKTLDMTCNPGMDKMFIFYPGTMPKIESLEITVGRRRHLPYSIVELRSLKKLKLIFPNSRSFLNLKDLQPLLSQLHCLPHLEYLRIVGLLYNISKRVRKLLPTHLLEKEREGSFTLII